MRTTPHGFPVGECHSTKTEQGGFAAPFGGRLVLRKLCRSPPASLRCIGIDVSFPMWMRSS